MISKLIQDLFYIDHLVLVVSDIVRTEIFYSSIFGPTAHKDDESIMYMIGNTKLFLVHPWGEKLHGDVFDSSRIGLEHFAINVANHAALESIEKVLNVAGVEHSGIHIDIHSNKEKIWLNDPDGIRLEFYMR